MKNQKYKWNLSLLYKNDDDPQIEKDVELSKKEILDFVKIYKETDRYLTDPSSLLLALDEYNDLNEQPESITRAWFYFYLRSDQDSTNTEIKKKLNNVEKVNTELSNELTFFTLNISKIDEKIQAEILEYKPLEKYKHWLEQQFIAGKYKLSEKEENILNLMSKPAYSNWTKFVSNQINKSEVIVVDSQGNKRKKAFNQVLADGMSSSDQVLRDSSAKGINKITKSVVELATEELNSVLEVQRVTNKLRGFDRPDASRHIEDDIDSKTVDTMVSAVTRKFEIPQRYYKLRAKMLGKESIKYHERVFSLNPKSEEYTFEQAKDFVLKTYYELDKELGDYATKFFDDGRIDVFPVKGKAGGAYCFGLSPQLPVYVLTNYTNHTNDILTIAHELGHGVNDELIAKNQNNINYGTPLSTAEVASTFFEDFTLDRVTKNATKEDRLYILMDKLNDDISTIFRQVALYNFETELHNSFNEKAYLSTKEICSMFAKHMHSYMGDGVSQDKGSENWWVYWSHIRRPFYVYSYASGLLISKALQNMVRENPKSIENVKEFLSTGLSKSPRDIFLSMNIDINDVKFWDMGIKRIEEMLIEAEQLADGKTRK